MKSKVLLLVAIALGIAASLAPSGTAASGLSLSGVVSNGGASIGGANVVAYAWPSQATQLATANNVQTSLDFVASGVTASNGAYSINADLSTLPSRDISPDGTVNLMVQANHQGYHWTTSLPASINTSATQQADLSDGTYSASLQQAETTASADGSVSPDLAGCGGGWWTGPYGPYQVKLADGDAGTNTTASLSYSNGGSTSTTLGIAYYDGSSWSASGTASNGTSSSYGFSTSGWVNHRFFGQWTYHQWHGCFGTLQDVPLKYVGRGNTNSIAHVTFSNCGGWYYAGDTYTRSSNKNQTYSVGLTVAGIGLSSQAGYESSNVLHYHFLAKGHVCGNSSSLYEGSPRVDAHQG